MKKIASKIVTILAACAAMAAIVSCSSPSTGDEQLTKIELGLTSMDGWGKYTVSDKSGTGFKMTHDAAVEKNSCGGADIAFGAAKKVTFKVTNNASDECWIQVLVKKDGSTTPVASGSRVTTAEIDGVAVAGDITWGVNTTIAAGASKVITLNLNGTDADKFVFALNSNDGNTTAPGDITVSEAYMYK